MSRIRDLSLQFKISSIYIITNLLVVMVNIVLIIGINSMSKRLDMVYQDNRHLNEFSDAINALQDDMTDYLNVKTSDSLENYYRSESLCRDMAIPFMIWTSKSFRDKYPERTKMIREAAHRPLSIDTVGHFILNLCGIDPPPYAESNPKP